MKTIKEMKYELWYERGYDYPYLNKISIPELKGVYLTEFNN